MDGNLLEDLLLTPYRSQLYYYLYCTYLGTELIAPYIASYTMEISVYIPLALTLACLVASLIALSQIEETPTRQTHLRPMEESRIVSEEESAPFENDSETAPRLSSMLSSRNVMSTLAIFILPAFRPTTTHVLLQYMSVRFHWKLAQSTIYISEVGLVNIFLFLLIAPRLIPWIQQRFAVGQETTDLWVVRASLILLVTGAVFLSSAASPSMIAVAVAVFASGFGLRVSLLSFATSLAEKHMQSRFYGVIQVMENAGYLIAAPILQAVWAQGLESGGPWLMLPFIVVAVSVVLPSMVTIYETGAD